MTSSSEARARQRRRAFAGLLLSAVGGCASGDDPVRPPSEARCDGVTTMVRSPAIHEAVVVSGTDVACFALAGAGAEYLVIPQLTGGTLPYGGYGYRLGDPELAPAPVAAFDAPAVHGGAPRPAAQERLDAALRAREARLRAVAPRPDAAARVDGAPALALGDPRTFSVLSTLDETPRFAPVPSTLRFLGSRVLLYVDTAAASVLSDADIAAMGALYDQSLAPAVHAAFGDGSDVDANGRLIFVLTPTVNAMVTDADCRSSGFVRGFFYGHDLASDAPTSNRGEIFYGYVPDAAGRWSCPHARDEVLANLPPTFVHELQHLISFGEHVIERGGTAEEPWLNEGLSHVAEEVGSRVFEARYPAPAGRSVPTQLFPDSSTAFITPDLLYSHRFLFNSGAYSLTGCAPGSFCSLNERGGIWLFLRWVADQHGAGTLRQLVETARTGRSNLEAVAGESTAALLGDFAVAVSADSIVGRPRLAPGSRHRFADRNLRRAYRALYDAYGVVGGVARPFPIEPLALDHRTERAGTMRPGTFVTYRLDLPDDAPLALLRFVSGDGTPFPTQSGAQVSVFRLR